MSAISGKSRKSMIEKSVRLYRFVEKHQELLSLLSEQDVSTKFVLPVLQALNWNPMKIRIDGPEVHEKGYRVIGVGVDASKKVKNGLPDFALSQKKSAVPFFVEVKHPRVGSLSLKALQRYRDGDLVFLTSFKESCLVVVGNLNRKRKCEGFIATSPERYVSEFPNLWKYISNSREAAITRKNIRSNRPGVR